MQQGISVIQIITSVLLVVILAILIWSWMPARDIYVSDLEFTPIKQDWYEPHRDMSVMENPLIIGEKTYIKGLGVHAESEIEVLVPEGYRRFVAEVGIDEEIASEAPASVMFTVSGDGAVLWQSPLMKANMPPQRVDVNVDGIYLLSLHVSIGGDDSNSDHADWGGARFVYR